MDRRLGTTNGGINFTPNYWGIANSETQYTTTYTFRTEYESMYNRFYDVIQPSEPKSKEKPEDWSKSKEVDEFLEGFEVR